MRSCKIGLGVFICLLVVSSTSLSSSLPMVFTASQVLAQTNTDRKAEADRLLQLGIQQFQAHLLETALQSFQKALIIYRNIKNRRGEGFALLGLGLVNSRLPDYPKQMNYYKQSLAIAREIKDSELEALVQKMLADAKIRSNPQKSEADRLNQQGIQHSQNGQFKAALLSWEQALQIYREIKDRPGEGGVLGNLGATYGSLGDYQKAIDFNQQSLVIAKELGNRADEGGALGNMGIAYRYLGDYKKAIEFHQQELAIATEIGDRDSVGRVLGNLGVAYYNLGDYQKAIEFHQQRLAIAREIGDRAGEGRALGNLGNAYFELGNYQKAIEFHQQNLAIAKEIGNRAAEARALGNLGNAYSELENYQKAIEFHQQNLAITKEIGNRALVGVRLLNLGNAYSGLGNYQKAIEFYEQSLAIAKEISVRKVEGVTLNNLGAALFYSWKFAEAEKVLKQGIEVWKSQRSRLGNRDDFKISIFEQQARTYRILQKVLIAQNQTDAALEVAESGRARAFVDLLASRLDPNGNVSSSTDATIEQIKQIAKSQNATLVQYSIIYDSFKTAGKQQAKESELYIWVIKPTGEAIFRKADFKPLWQKEKTNLEQLVKISRRSISVRSVEIENVPKPNPENQKKCLQKLHEILISPIADLLPKKETDRVVFIPQESLFLVPFPALQNENGKYLIEKHTILTSPSIQVLDLTKKQHQKLGNKPIQTNKMLIVGNPIMPKVPIKVGETPQQLPPLAGAEKEAIAIANLFKIQPLIGKQATESTVVERLPQAQIIHFATHGLFDDIRGLDSSIALTPENPTSLSSPLSKEDKKRDGLLTADEILDLKLNANLVVLSACDTGRGKITGDGVIGLSRSLISAGTPSVIVSLWSVDDGSTAFLMTEFYQNLQRKMDKATALRKAMLDTKKKYSSPSQWAAFTLIGEAE
ncbi:CHAT domain-containing protein [Iningainema sp. BLCCT55]|uniref:CHAT domain-containing protein n=2 Tax=Iningainema TaxID=1932705 RepID=A0A8J6XNB8_9CYAN|nr:CHAT domain-containing tetratricopeptide repeat protein [Iningainema tapete]MBD2776397.1 CHAT domain-containing protein [Iningainema tapete BLCC-T55]